MSYSDNRKINYDTKLPNGKQFHAMWDLLISIADHTGAPIPASTQEVIDFMGKVKDKFPVEEGDKKEDNSSFNQLSPD